MIRFIGVYLTGCLIFLTYVMIIKKNKINTLANNWLILFFITLVFAFLVGNLREFQLYLIYPKLYKFLDITTFAIAPSLFLAIKYYTSPLNKINKKDFNHLIPALLYFVINIKYVFYSNNELLEIITNPPKNKVLFQILEFGFIIQCITYLIIAFFKLKKYQNNLKRYDSSNSKSLRWLEFIIYILAVLLILWILNTNKFFGNYIIIGYAICIFYLGYYAINQLEIFPYSDDSKSQLNTLLSEEVSEPKNQIINKEQLNLLKSRLLKIMENEKPYLDNELNLIKLSTLLEISIKELSFVVNEGIGENFNQFINRYRVEESKKLLIDSNFNNLNMLGIAYQAGFNSKTIFNTAFKKHTGMTPSEFQKFNKKSVPNLDMEQ